MLAFQLLWNLLMPSAHCSSFWKEEELQCFSIRLHSKCNNNVTVFWKKNVTLSSTVGSSAAPCTLLLLLKRGGTTLLFHHKLQTRNHGDTPHKKDLMMLMIERCAMVACYGTHWGPEGSANPAFFVCLFDWTLSVKNEWPSLLGYRLISIKSMYVLSKIIIKINFVWFIMN